MKGLKKIMAMAMALTLAFAMTAFAAATPVADLTKTMDRTSIYGTYTMYDYGRGINIDAEIGFYTDGDCPDYIHFSTAWHGNDNIYTGIMEYVGGNVYVASGEPGSIRITFGDDGGMLVEVINDYEDRLNDTIAGVYDLVDRLDLNHVA